MMARKLTVISATVCALSLAASPALAAKVHKKKASHAQAQAAQKYKSFDPNAVYGWDGSYRGSDPDPNIRFQLMRDLNQPND